MLLYDKCKNNYHNCLLYNVTYYYCNISILQYKHMYADDILRKVVYIEIILF